MIASCVFLVLPVRREYRNQVTWGLIKPFIAYQSHHMSEVQCDICSLSELNVSKPLA